MSTQGITLTREPQIPSMTREKDQYSLWQIAGIWLVACAPMWLLSWVIAPLVIPYSPLYPGITYWLLIIAGMGWQFVVSLMIVYHELGTLRWRAIRQRTWLQTPRDPKTDQPNPKLFKTLQRDVGRVGSDVRRVGVRKTFRSTFETMA